MTAKEFLQRYLILHRSIERQIDEISNLQSVAKQITTVFRDVPCGSDSSQSRVEKSVVEIQQKTERFADEIAGAVDLREEIAEAISHVKNHDERFLLEMRYLCLQPWEYIARKMNFSLDHVFTLHRQALRNFAQSLNLTVNNS